jgi:peptidoglycan/LPS O-acetylase OafA/YrhL
VKGIKWLATKASRDTSTGGFIAEIDGLRFIAILSVFLFHLSGYENIIVGKGHKDFAGDLLAGLLSHGHIGVQLFFILSGFVIALPYAKGEFLGSKVPKLKQFFVRRLSRLEPPYFINLFISFLLIKHLTVNKALDAAPHLLASMAYLHNMIFSAVSSINSVAWSLEVELQFYLLAPLLSYMFKIKDIYFRRGVFIGLITVFSILNAVVGDEVSLRFGLSLLSQAQFFFTGFLLLDIYLIDWKQNPEKLTLWDIVSFIAWVSIAAILYLGKSVQPLVVLPMFLAYCAAFKGTLSNRFFRQPIVYTIGGMCYTIYLYHFIIINLMMRFVVMSKLFDYFPVWASIIISGAFLGVITLSICTILFIYIEKPCMKRDWYVNMFQLRFAGAKDAARQRES